MIYDNNHNIIPPFYERVNRFLSYAGYSFPNTLPATLLTFPPWAVPDTEYNVELQSFDKSQTNPSLLQAAFHALISSIARNPIILYTDASLNPITGTVGSAVVAPDSVLKFHLPEGTTIFTGELFAIHQALVYIISTGTPGQKYAICSDSLSSIISLKALFSNNPVVHLVKSLLFQLMRCQLEVIFVFAPSHVGIQGNERADVAAREAAVPLDSCNIDIHTPQDVKSSIQRILNKKRQEHWHTSESKLRQVKPILSGAMNFSANRSDQVKLSRLRLGHTRLTHSFLITGEDPPLCLECNTRMTVQHIIIECRRFNDTRKKHQIAPTLEVALGNDLKEVSKTMKYLRDINVYKDI